MKQITLILISAVLIACNNPAGDAGPKPVTGSGTSKETDSALHLPIVKNIAAPSVINTAGKTIDILFNGIDNYLGGQRNSKAGFSTECMICEPVQQYKEGFLFAKRLYVTSDSVTMYKTDRAVSDTAGVIKMLGNYDQRKTAARQFSQGTVKIRYLGQSCSDAGFMAVSLRYKNGSVEFDSLINASFFEYDLDRNGVQEQYLLGTRNCSQEMALIRVNNND